MCEKERKKERKKDELVGIVGTEIVVDVENVVIVVVVVAVVVGSLAGFWRTRRGL